MTTNAITISLAEIREQSPCAVGWRKVLAAKGGKDADMEARFPLADIIETNSLDDCLWAMRCRPEYNNLWRKYAVWCARQVEHLMTDDRSKSALNVAWRHSDGLATDEELAAGGGAARAAARATGGGAAWAATSAATSAAGSSAARAAGRASAWDVARATAWAAQKQKLIEILNAGEWV